MPIIETTRWTATDVANIRADPATTAPLIETSAVARILAGVDLWDLWPIQHRDGSVADVAGGALYMLLSAPASPDPEARHGLSRIRLMLNSAGQWRDLGLLFPDGFTPGSREWAGSAVLDADQVTVWFTAAGWRGEPNLSFDQRIFQATGTLRIVDGEPAIGDWTQPRECFRPDGAIYMRDMTGGGRIGTIKAFRDPGYFRDPATGGEYLLFTGSMANSGSDWNGAIGIAERRPADEWSLLPPLITAERVNNELERPHLVFHHDRYYLFWSTQTKVFATNGPSGPTGLYGMVSHRMGGPWRPMNGSGLVIANPPAAPFQAFSWLVAADLTVRSFIDHPGLRIAPADATDARQSFGGTPAPVLKLRLDRDRSIVSP